MLRPSSFRMRPLPCRNKSPRLLSPASRLPRWVRSNHNSPRVAKPDRNCNQSALHRRGHPRITRKGQREMPHRRAEMEFRLPPEPELSARVARRMRLDPSQRQPLPPRLRGMHRPKRAPFPRARRQAGLGRTRWEECRPPRSLPRRLPRKLSQRALPIKSNGQNISWNGRIVRKYKRHTL